MAGIVETTRSRPGHFHRRERKHPIKDISTPVLAFTDANPRDDIYALPSRISQSGIARPRTSDGTKTKKKIHVADLIQEKSPQLPAQFTPTLQRPVEYDPDTIGIAIGSPTHWPWINYERYSIDSVAPSPRVPSSVASTMQSCGVSAAYKESSKRKLFSSIFGKGSSKSAQRPFYVAQTAPAPPSFGPPGHRRQRSQSLDLFPAMNPAIATQPALLSEHKWSGLSRKVSLTRRGNGNNTSMDIKRHPDQPPPPPPKDYPVRPTTILPSPISPPEPSPLGLPLLTLDIPDTKMDRYSVMFGHVLGRPKSTLLDRRQSNLKGLQISHNLVDNPIRSPGLSSARRNTIPSPRSPHMSLLFPMPPGTPSMLSDCPSPQRSGLSRSNTLPSPRRNSLTVSSGFPKRKESHVDNLVSPSHGSETPISIASDWQSDESRDLSDISDEDEDDCYDDQGSADITIQLSDLPLPQALYTQPTRPHSPISKYFLPYVPQARKAVPEVVNHAPRSSSRFRAVTDHHPMARAQSPALRRKQSLPVEISKGQSADGQIIAPTTVTLEAAGTRPIQRINPLKSSPVSPTEITLARQLSQSKGKQFFLAGSRMACQPKSITIVNPDTFVIPDSKGMPHVRNKSEHVMVVEA